MRKAPKITHKVLHPGICKLNVPVALAIFYDFLSATLTSYFLENKNEVEFLKLFSTRWIISSSKVQFSNHIFAMRQKNNFVVRMQIELKIGVKRESHHLNNSLSHCQLIQILRCQAGLIEYLFDDGYDFILTARFQSYPLERRFNQCRQISGGRFVVGLKDTICSERILKIKSLLKEGIDINMKIKISCPEEMES